MSGRGKLSHVVLSWTFLLFHHELFWGVFLILSFSKNLKNVNRQCFKAIFTEVKNLTTGRGHFYEYQWMYSMLTQKTFEKCKWIHSPYRLLIAIKQVPPSATMMSHCDLFPICFLAQQRKMLKYNVLFSVRRDPRGPLELKADKERRALR